MIAAGIQAVLIKVAGIGLTTKHLSKTLSEMQQTLVTLVGSSSLTSLLMWSERLP
jgi:diphthine-ammonia ligase